MKFSLSSPCSSSSDLNMRHTEGKAMWTGGAETLYAVKATDEEHKQMTDD